MATLLHILDLVVLVLLIVHLIRVVSAFGSVLLSICVGLAGIVLAIISLGVYVGLVGESSTLAQVISLLILLAMAWVILSSWKSNPAT